MTLVTRAAALLVASLLPLAAIAAPGPITLQPFLSGLAAPVEITHANDFSGRLFIVEQGGRIRLAKNGVLQSAAFLDLRASVGGPVQTGGEKGLLGLAFHPQYAANGRLFVFYTRALAGDTAGSELVVARYTRSAQNADAADAASASVVIVVPHPQQGNHNGGKIAFGPDGYLYIGVGDGGGGGDPFNAGQNLADLRGKLLRIDVDGAAPYAIPPTNPFALVGAPVRGEIWAYGLRNPWRFSFDRETGDLFIGDVGQGAWEEIDYQPRGDAGGRNYGWRIFEGTHCHNPSVNCSLANHTPPILEYGHDANGGSSVTGGYRYRGRRVAELRGFYVYGDYGSGRIWAAEPVSGGAWTTTQVATSGSLTTFGEDENGELYVANAAAGTILRIAPADTDADGLSNTWEQAYFGSATAGVATDDGDGDGLTNLREYEEGRNPLVKDNDIVGNPRLFAMQQYRDFLGREGDAGGIAAWVAYLGSGGTRAAIAESFLLSPEFQGAVAPVARLYFAYFLRAPDYGGLTFWLSQYRGGASLAAISAAFAASAEFTGRYGALSNAQFVTLVYQNVLGRAPDAGGLAFWTGQLDAATQTRGQVMLGFSESAEYRAAIANEVFVTMAYAGMLKRAPDPAGFSFWVTQLDGGASGQGLVGGFLAAAEYRLRFLP